MPHPQRLLTDITWACRRQRYPDREAFAAEMQSYQDKSMGDRSAWRPGERVLEAPAVWIQFACWDKACTVRKEPVIELIAEDGEGFTALELFHRMVDEMGRVMLDEGDYLYDHCFFEGLSKADESPRYHVEFGS